MSGFGEQILLRSTMRELDAAGVHRWDHVVAWVLQSLISCESYGSSKCCQRAAAVVLLGQATKAACLAKQPSALAGLADLPHFAPKCA